MKKNLLSKRNIALLVVGILVSALGLTYVSLLVRNKRAADDVIVTEEEEVANKPAVTTDEPALTADEIEGLKASGLKIYEADETAVTETDPNVDEAEEVVRIEPTEEEIPVQEVVEPVAESYVDQLKNRTIDTSAQTFTDTSKGVVVGYLDRSYLEGFELVEDETEANGLFNLFKPQACYAADIIQTSVAFYIGEESKSIYAQDLLFGFKYKVLEIETGQIVNIMFSRSSLSLVYLTFVPTDNSLVSGTIISQYSILEGETTVIDGSTYFASDVDKLSVNGRYLSYSDGYPANLIIYDLVDQEAILNIEAYSGQFVTWSKDEVILYYVKSPYNPQTGELEARSLVKVNVLDGSSETLVEDFISDALGVESLMIDPSNESTIYLTAYIDDIWREDTVQQSNYIPHIVFGKYSLETDTATYLNELDDVEQFLISPDGSVAYLIERDWPENNSEDEPQYQKTYYSRVDLDTMELTRLDVLEWTYWKNIIGWNGDLEHLMFENHAYLGQFENEAGESYSKYMNEIWEYNTVTQEVVKLYEIEVGGF